jgi:acyl-CoA dehydrogenase
MAQRVLDPCMQRLVCRDLYVETWCGRVDRRLSDFNYARGCRQAEGPGQVHMMALGRELVKRYAES